MACTTVEFNYFLMLVCIYSIHSSLLYSTLFLCHRPEDEASSQTEVSCHAENILSTLQKVFVGENSNKQYVSV